MNNGYAKTHQVAEQRAWVLISEPTMTQVVHFSKLLVIETLTTARKSTSANKLTL